MKKGLGILLILTLVGLSLIGCSSKEKTSETSPESSSSAKLKNKTITFATIKGYYSDGLQAVAEDYHKLHPETTVKIDVIPDNQAYQTNFKTKMATGGDDAPDIIHTNIVGDTTGNMIKNNMLLNLNDFSKQSNPYNNGKSVLEAITPDYHPFAYSENGDIAYLPFDLVGTGFYYNKDIFAKLNLKEPTTWEELLEVSKKLKAANYIPIAYPFTPELDGEAWMRAAFVDWTARPLYEKLLVLPGDARSTADIEKINTKVKYSVDNAFFDVGAIFDPEKVMALWKNKEYDNQGPAEKKYWPLLKELSQYYAPGYATMSDQEAYSLFLAQKSAIYWNGSWKVGTLISDQKKLGDKAFKWGTFKFPDFATPDPNFQGKPRGILVPGHQLGLSAKKDQEQLKRAQDFMMYLYSPAVAQKVYEVTLAAGQFVQGPSLIEGVKLPDEVNSYLAGFKVAGNAQQTVVNWISNGNPTKDANLGTEYKALELKYYDGKITLDEFLKQKEAFVDKTLKLYITKNNYDLDPKTNP